MERDAHINGKIEIFPPTLGPLVSPLKNIVPKCIHCWFTHFIGPDVSLLLSHCRYHALQSL